MASNGDGQEDVAGERVAMSGGRDQKTLEPEVRSKTGGKIIGLEQVVQDDDNLAPRDRDRDDRPIVVTMPPRLRPFSGDIPTPAGEASYEEFRSQLPRDLDLPRLKSSLRGTAYKQCHTLGSTDTILERLELLFGDLTPLEDLLEDFQNDRKLLKEQPSDYLIRLWSKINRVASKCSMESSELSRKLYHKFVRGLPSVSSLTIECRTKFGIPGNASPKVDDLLTYVRLSQCNESAKIHAVAQESLNEDLISEVCNRVVNQLKPLLKEKSSVEKGSVNRPVTVNRSITCYQCGQQGHIRRYCPLNRPGSLTTGLRQDPRSQRPNHQN